MTPKVKFTTKGLSTEFTTQGFVRFFSVLFILVPLQGKVVFELDTTFLTGLQPERLKLKMGK